MIQTELAVLLERKLQIIEEKLDKLLEPKSELKVMEIDLNGEIRGDADVIGEEFKNIHFTNFDLWESDLKDCKFFNCVFDNVFLKRNRCENVLLQDCVIHSIRWDYEPIPSRCGFANIEILRTKIEGRLIESIKIEDIVGLEPKWH